jgi:hypothetical protein
MNSKKLLVAKIENEFFYPSVLTSQEVLNRKTTKDKIEYIFIDEPKLCFQNYSENEVLYILLRPELDQTVIMLGA